MKFMDKPEAVEKARIFAFEFFKEVEYIAGKVNMPFKRDTKLDETEDGDFIHHFSIDGQPFQLWITVERQKKTQKGWILVFQLYLVISYPGQTHMGEVIEPPSEEPHEIGPTCFDYPQGLIEVLFETVWKSNFDVAREEYAHEQRGEG